MCEKITLPREVREQGERFEEAKTNERIYQAILNNYAWSDEMKKMSIIASVVFGGLAMLLLIVSIMSNVEMVGGLAGISMGIVLIIWTQRFLDSRFSRDRKRMKKIGTEEAVAERKRILACRQHKLCWILLKRIERFNGSLDVISEMQNDEYRHWANQRMESLRIDLVEELEARLFFDGAPTDVGYVAALDRLRHFLMLEPDEYLRAQNIEFRGRM